MTDAADLTSYAPPPPPIVSAGAAGLVVVPWGSFAALPLPTLCAADAP